MTTPPTQAHTCVKVDVSIIAVTSSTIIETAPNCTKPHQPDIDVCVEPEQGLDGLIVVDPVVCLKPGLPESS
jgi:hypothetical protein